MKIIAIGDTHGRSYWKYIANHETFDKLVFIGDYFDSFHISGLEQVQNFRDIITYKKAFPEKVILLLGNHDFHYLPVARKVNETYSGFQERYASLIGHLLLEHMDVLVMCCHLENYLFPHAGITHTWVEQAGYKEGPIDVFVNDLFTYKPQSFFFQGFDPYGDDLTQSPLWVRPRSLKADAFEKDTFRQVVGHTPMRKLSTLDTRHLFIDTLDTSCEYLIMDQGKLGVDRWR
ncbi:MAG: metallophosphoesterase [Flavisolibacter sp.]